MHTQEQSSSNEHCCCLSNVRLLNQASFLECTEKILYTMSNNFYGMEFTASNIVIECCKFCNSVQTHRHTSKHVVVTCNTRPIQNQNSYLGICYKLCQLFFCYAITIFCWLYQPNRSSSTVTNPGSSSSSPACSNGTISDPYPLYGTHNLVLRGSQFEHIASTRKINAIWKFASNCSKCQCMKCDADDVYEMHFQQLFWVIVAVCTSVIFAADQFQSAHSRHS